MEATTFFYLFSRKPSPAPSFYMKDSFQSDAKEIATYLHCIIYGNKLYVQKKDGLENATKLQHDM